MPGTSPAWRCTVCGYVHCGDEPPEGCPACGATADCFEPVTEPAPPAAVTTRAVRVVIIGAGDRRNLGG